MVGLEACVRDAAVEHILGTTGVKKITKEMLPYLSEASKAVYRMLGIFLASETAGDLGQGVQKAITALTSPWAVSSVLVKEVQHKISPHVSN